MFKTLAAAAVLLAASTGAQALSIHSSAAEIAQWTATHTEAPSHFSAQTPVAHFNGVPQPYGFQAPAGNASFTDPTGNSVNSVQAHNTIQGGTPLPVGQATQGRNCSAMMIRAGLCQHR